MYVHLTDFNELVFQLKVMYDTDYMSCFGDNIIDGHSDDGEKS